MNLLLAGDEDQYATRGQLPMDLAHLPVRLGQVIVRRSFVEMYRDRVLPRVNLSVAQQS